ncbi:uncharacterized protein [Macrobrachium rosenbergii]|uniref:uncharacterized protein n=1 Tax=Macrobrachium rosenbergii TaxID=79674 RepID=UPI0034D403B5
MVNAASNALHLPPIMGDYDLGYIYGNVKTHKQGNTLRPITSQIPAPTYHHSLKSSAEFLEALRAAPNGGCIASMDVEFLFTNVPVDETIQMILDRVYRDPTTPSLNIPEHTLRALLEICTKRAFSPTIMAICTPRSTGWRWVLPSESFSPISMWALWSKGYSKIYTNQGCTCATTTTPSSAANSQEEVENLRRAFHNHSCLSFRIEQSQNRCLPFLDVLVEQREASFSTRVYTKRTNLGMFMNGASKCPGGISIPPSAPTSGGPSHTPPPGTTHMEK